MDRLEYFKNHIHFSIDDVIGTFKWIHYNVPLSIFDEPMLKQLKTWHELYGLSCDLYLYEETEGFNITQLDDVYWTEMAKESKWLKVCWHRKHAGEIMEDIEEEEQSFCKMKYLVCQKVRESLWSNTVRLHKYRGDKEFLEFLQNEGIQIFLTSENNICSYYINEDETKILNHEGYFCKDDILFLRTNIRLDYLSDINLKDTVLQIRESVNEYRSKGIILYCHAWNFNNISGYLDKLWKEVSDLL